MQEKQDSSTPTESAEPLVSRTSSAAPRPGGLASVPDVRAEIARLYRDARVGKMEPAELTKLVWALRVLWEIVRSEKIDNTPTEHKEADLSKLEASEMQELDRLMRKAAGEPDQEYIPK